MYLAEKNVELLEENGKIFCNIPLISRLDTEIGATFSSFVT